MNKPLILRLARLGVALVVVLVYGPEIAHALWTAVVWLFHHPWIGGPVFVILLVFGPIVAAAATEPEAGR